MKEKEENKSLFLLKGISCILVILFHCPLSGILGDFIIYVFRFPVPIFFLISGYYSFYKTDYLIKIKRMLLFIVQAELIAAAASAFCFLMGQEQYNLLNILKIHHFTSFFIKKYRTRLSDV